MSVLRITNKSAPDKPPLGLILLGRKTVYVRIIPRCPVKNPDEMGFIGHISPKKLLRIIESEPDRWDIHVHFGTVRYGETHRKENIIGTSWVPLDLDHKDHLAPSLHEVILEIAMRDLPLPTLVYRTPSGGYRVLWRLKRPAFFDHEDSRVRELWISFYETVQRELCRTLKDLGADEAAVGVHHLFRVWPAELVYHEPANRTSLRKLLDAARRYARGQEKARAGVKLTKGPREALDRNPAWRWLNAQVFKKGNRNQAFLSYLILSGHGGKFPSEDEALAWARGHTDPPYPEGEARAVYRCARRALEAGELYGISPRRLRALGMPDDAAREALKLAGMRFEKAWRWSGPRKPLDERIHKPRILRFAQLLEFIARTGTRKASARELARKAGIPYSTLTETLAPVVRAWRGPGGNSFFSLSRNTRPAPAAVVLPPHLKSIVTRQFLIQSLQALFGRSGLDLWRTIRYWARRDGKFWTRLWVAAKRVVGLLAGPSPLPPGPQEEDGEGPEEALRRIWLALAVLGQNTRQAEFAAG